MYDIYFQQRQLIPDGHLHEISFEDLEADPVEALRKVYDALELPNFSYCEPKLREYVLSRDGYKKNEYPDLANDTCERLAREWHACFEKWSYPTTISQDTHL